MVKMETITTITTITSNNDNNDNNDNNRLLLGELEVATETKARKAIMGASHIHISQIKNHKYTNFVYL